MTETQVREMYEGSYAKLVKTLANVGIHLSLIGLIDFARYINSRKEAGYSALPSKEELKAYFGGFAGTKIVLTSDENLDRSVINHFYHGNGEPMYWGKDSMLSKKLADNAIFQEYFHKYVDVVRSNVDNLEAIDGGAIGTMINTPNFSALSLGNVTYYGLMGGTQKIKVELNIAPLPNGKKSLHTIMHIYDWYGADFEDIKGMGLKAQMDCLNAFYWLQYHYGYKPFQTEIIYEHTDIL